MFLGVSVNVQGVDMNQAQRDQFAEWLRGLQVRKFDSNAKAAYTAAGVNSGTWTRALTGLPLRAQSVSKIVRAFRPDTEGDWTRLDLDGDADVGGVTNTPAGYVSGPGELAEGGADESEVLRAIAAMRQDMQAMEQRLSERLDRLEGGS